MPSVLGKSRPRHSVLDLDREAFIARLADLLRAKNVTSAYLVGSMARGEAHAWSDVDLVIVCETDLPFVERPRSFTELYQFGVPVDVLVYTPSEFLSLENDPTSFWRTTQRDRVRIV